MNTLTKLVLGAMGALRPEPALGSGERSLVLPPPERALGVPLMQALAGRQSQRNFDKKALPLATLSTLLWAADGVNRPDGGRTAPSAMGAKEVQVYAALPQGAYRYDPDRHELQLAASADVRRVTGYQDFVDDAPLDLVFVADHRHMSMVPVAQREAYANVSCGAMAQNVYLACAALGLATVVRAWIDREAIARALGLSMDQHVLLSQTVGYPTV
ncbi:MAG: SagB/ThcOx family dehydrogenase [Rhizobacter sp.]|nr:SagB/ThcOx family dehydrogenase [Rhizobacter sp.]